MPAKEIQTIADIGRLAGVSKSTVSRALSGSPLISEETTKRIRAIAKEHNFQLNIPARRLSLKQSNTIAFVTNAHKHKYSCLDLFTFEILGGIMGALHDNGYDLLMVNIDPGDNHWAVEHLEAGKADGFILMTSSRKQSHIKLLAEMGAPFVAWGIPLPKYNYCTVTGDNFNGGKLATERLISLGRRSIAFLGGPKEEMEIQYRYEGYVAALKAVGITPDPSLVTHCEFWDSSAVTETRALLAQAPGFNALFANNDLMAIEAMRVLHEAGKRVPEDVAVIGYDNLTISVECTPTLTTISQNVHVAGRMLAQNLLQYLKTRVVTHVTMPVELVVRQSA